MQGDLLFTDDKKNGVVGGERSIVFTTNTITYTAIFVTSADMYDRIRAAKIGIIFHTSYSGKTMKGLKASFGASVSGLKKQKRIL